MKRPERSLAESDVEDAARRRRALRFVLRFVVFAGAGLTLYGFPYDPQGPAERWFALYLAGYARAAGAVLSLFESGVSVNGTSISGRITLEIIKNCDAMEVMLLFAAATFAIDGRLRDRLLALVAGIAALVTLNIARICSLYFIQIHLPDAFETIHLELWPPILVACAALQFLAIAHWLQRRPARTAHAAG